MEKRGVLTFLLVAAFLISCLPAASADVQIVGSGRCLSATGQYRPLLDVIVICGCGHVVPSIFQCSGDNAAKEQAAIEASQLKAKADAAANLAIEAERKAKDSKAKALACSADSSKCDGTETQDSASADKLATKIRDAASSMMSAADAAGILARGGLGGKDGLTGAGAGGTGMGTNAAALEAAKKLSSTIDKSKADLTDCQLKGGDCSKKEAQLKLAQSALTQLNSYAQLDDYSSTSGNSGSALGLMKKMSAGFGTLSPFGYYGDTCAKGVELGILDPEECQIKAPAKPSDKQTTTPEKEKTCAPGLINTGTATDLKCGCPVGYHVEGIATVNPTCVENKPVESSDKITGKFCFVNEAGARSCGNLGPPAFICNADKTVCTSGVLGATDECAMTTKIKITKLPTGSPRVEVECLLESTEKGDHTCAPKTAPPCSDQKTSGSVTTFSFGQTCVRYPNNPVSNYCDISSDAHYELTL